MELVCPARVEHLLEEGGQVVHPWLVKGVVPETEVVVGKLGVRPGVCRTPCVGQPDIVARVCQQEGQVVVTAAEHPVVGALQDPVRDQDGSLGLNLVPRRLWGAPPLVVLVQVAVVVRGPRPGPAAAAPRDADQHGHVAVLGAHAVGLDRVALAPDELLRGHDGLGVVQGAAADPQPVQVARQHGRRQQAEDGALEEADLGGPGRRRR